MEALRESRLAPVRRADRVAEARHPADVVAPGAGAQRDRLRPEAAADVEQALRVIDEIDRRRADRAEPSVIERRGGVALDLDQAPVAHVQQRTAAAVAGAADALVDARITVHGSGSLVAAGQAIHLPQRGDAVPVS